MLYLAYDKSRIKVTLAETPKKNKKTLLFIIFLMGKTLLFFYCEV